MAEFHVNPAPPTPSEVSAPNQTHLQCNHIAVDSVAESTNANNIFLYSHDAKRRKLSPYKFNSDLERMLFAKMVIKHDFPFSLAGCEYFKQWISYVCPGYEVRPQSVLVADMMNLFEEEKGIVYGSIVDLSYKVSITADLWTSEHQGFRYYCISCHFIDDEWKLHNKLLAFRYVECPNTPKAMFEWLKDKILEWEIEEKVFAIVVGNNCSSAQVVSSIKTWLNAQDGPNTEGKLFHAGCLTSMINLVVNEGLEVISSLLEKVRDSLKHINSSTCRNQKFKEALIQTNLDTKAVVGIDKDTNWKSTYLMLQNALEVREAFEHLHKSDEEYSSLPTAEEWNMGA